MISVVKASFHFVEVKKKNSIEQKSFAQIDNFNNEFLVSKNILAFVKVCRSYVSSSFDPNWKIGRKKEEKNRIFKDLAGRKILDMFSIRIFGACIVAEKQFRGRARYAYSRQRGERGEMPAMEMQFSSPRSFGTTFT